MTETLSNRQAKAAAGGFLNGDGTFKWAALNELTAHIDRALRIDPDTVTIYFRGWLAEKDDDRIKFSNQELWKATGIRAEAWTALRDGATTFTPEQALTVAQWMRTLDGVDASAEVAEHPAEPAKPPASRKARTPKETAQV